MASFASHIEYTLLRQTAKWEDIKQLIDTAAEEGYYGVCVAPYFVKQAAFHIRQNQYKQKLITVIGFPLGYSSVSAKVEEVKKAIMEGADELDMVVNLSAYLSKDMAVVKNDIQSVVTACHLQNKKVKVILETGALTETQMLKLADICVAAGADFVKTSTGFYETGAELDKVKALKDQLPAKVKIKASGGIKTREEAQAFIDAGASRIGTSSKL
ncbi:MAG: deoxyribose-phosphate aldolase [Bacteroidota bacterium]|nr:deoxyribose-phosphate aldolase [Bacteroidota bacterium]MDX5431705.1 deoxyribose-phosphate aldolase [Bacteroidota bacterium]MDX5470420.1 deoxyribose-phosphate aldolase [Bacteroidota bacterium]